MDQPRMTFCCPKCGTLQVEVEQATVDPRYPLGLCPTDGRLPLIPASTYQHVVAQREVMERTKPAKRTPRKVALA